MPKGLESSSSSRMSAELVKMLCRPCHLCCTSAQLDRVVSIARFICQAPTRPWKSAFTCTPCRVSHAISV